MPELTDHQQRTCCVALGKYGRKAQLLKVAEELRELADEVEKEANDEGDSSRLALERADVAVTLWQLDNLLCPGITPFVGPKIQAQITRLAERMRT